MFGGISLSTKMDGTRKIPTTFDRKHQNLQTQYRCITTSLIWDEHGHIQITFVQKKIQKIGFYLCRPVRLVLEFRCHHHNIKIKINRTLYLILNIVKCRDVGLKRCLLPRFLLPLIMIIIVVMIPLFRLSWRSSPVRRGQTPGLHVSHLTLVSPHGGGGMVNQSISFIHPVFIPYTLNINNLYCPCPICRDYVI